MAEIPPCSEGHIDINDCPFVYNLMNASLARLDGEKSALLAQLERCGYCKFLRSALQEQGSAKFQWDESIFTPSASPSPPTSAFAPPEFIPSGVEGADKPESP